MKIFTQQLFSPFSTLKLFRFIQTFFTNKSFSHFLSNLFFFKLSNQQKHFSLLLLFYRNQIFFFFTKVFSLKYSFNKLNSNLHRIFVLDDSNDQRHKDYFVDQMINQWDYWTDWVDLLVHFHQQQSFLL